MIIGIRQGLTNQLLLTNNKHHGHDFYHVYEPGIAEATMKSMRRHLWYGTPELVVLSLFDEYLPDTEKMMMASTMQQTY